MDHNSRKSGIGSKDPPRAMPSDPSQGGRVAATALGKPGKDDHGVKRSHDHVKMKEPQRISKDYAKLKDQRPQPRVDRNENDRERDILNQSIKRAKGAEGANRAMRDESAREREILSQSLKRTKAAGGEDPKRVKDRDQEVQRAKGEDRERHILKRNSDDSKVRLENPVKSKTFNSKVRLGNSREPVQSKSATRPDDLKVRLEKSKSATRPDGARASVPDKSVKKETSRLPDGKPGDIVKEESLLSDRKPDESKVRLENPVKSKIFDSKVRLENSREPVKSKSATRPDGARASVPDKAGDVVKKENLSSDSRKRTMAEDVQRSVTKMEPVVVGSNKNGRDVSRSVKMVTGTVVKAKQEKVKKKVFSLPGQRFEAPEERDALRLFYGSLHRQIPTSDMANIWLMEHGLLEADEAQKVLTQKVKSKTGFVSKTPTPSKFSNGSAGKSSKFKSEDLLDIKPVSKKLKL